MRRAFVVLGGALGAAAFWRKRRPHAQPELPVGPDPAAELRAKLAASKAATPEGASLEEPAREEPVATGEPLAEAEPTLDPDTRRRSVHERARSAIDELDT